MYVHKYIYESRNFPQKYPRCGSLLVAHFRIPIPYPRSAHALQGSSLETLLNQSGGSEAEMRDCPTTANRKLKVTSYLTCAPGMVHSLYAGYVVQNTRISDIITAHVQEHQQLYHPRSQVNRYRYPCLKEAKTTQRTRDRQCCISITSNKEEKQTDTGILAAKNVLFLSPLIFTASLGRLTVTWA